MLVNTSIKKVYESKRQHCFHRLFHSLADCVLIASSPLFWLQASPSCQTNPTILYDHGDDVQDVEDRTESCLSR